MTHPTGRGLVGKSQSCGTKRFKDITPKKWEDCYVSFWSDFICVISALIPPFNVSSSWLSELAQAQLQAGSTDQAQLQAGFTD